MIIRFVLECCTIWLLIKCIIRWSRYLKRFAAGMVFVSLFVLRWLGLI
jgi:hypothetical protein